jgi:hypothetical protein
MVLTSCERKYNFLVKKYMIHLHIMCAMPRRKKHNEFYLGSQRRIDEEKERIEDYELEVMTQLAEMDGDSTEPEGLAERVGWVHVGNKTLDEKIKQVEKLRDGWVMKKTKKGDVFITVSEVKHHPGELKKYDRGRIQITVPAEWVGYTAMVVLSKTKTPKFKSYVEEVTLEELRDEDPSGYADIVFEPRKVEKKFEGPKKESPSMSEEEFWDSVLRGFKE